MSSTGCSMYVPISVLFFTQGQTYTCPEGRFYCGSLAAAAASNGARNVLDYNGGGRSAVRLPSMGICVSERVRCDGVVNCPDGRDEFSSLCNYFQGESLAQPIICVQFDCIESD